MYVHTAKLWYTSLSRPTRIQTLPLVQRNWGYAQAIRSPVGGGGTVKITVMQEQLQKGLGHVSRAAATKTSLPVLGNILLATDRGQLKLAATNLEIGITCWIDCAIEEEGQ